MGGKVCVANNFDGICSTPLFIQSTCWPFSDGRFTCSTKHFSTQKTGGLHLEPAWRTGAVGVDGGRDGFRCATWSARRRTRPSLLPKPRPRPYLVAVERPALQCGGIFEEGVERGDPVGAVAVRWSRGCVSGSFDGPETDMSSPVNRAPRTGFLRERTLVILS